MFQNKYTVDCSNLFSFFRNFDSLLVTRYNITSYEGWNFNSGNYLFTTDTK